MSRQVVQVCEARICFPTMPVFRTNRWQTGRERVRWNPLLCTIPGWISLSAQADNVLIALGHYMSETRV